VLTLLIPLLTFWFAADHAIRRAEGLILLLLFAGWMGLHLRAAAAHRQAVAATDSAAGSTHPLAALAWGVGGLIALIAAGRLFIVGASGIATALGLDTFVIGATVVAIGTSLPELVTVILSRLRGHDDVGVGTVLGSNLFNGLAIVG
jgi:cation:H+ antiporter